MVDGALWSDRILTALAAAAAKDPPQDVANVQDVLRWLAIAYADAFAAGDRAYDGGTPVWQGAARDALTKLRSDGLVESRRGYRLTAAGSAAAQQAAARIAAAPQPEPPAPGPAADGGEGPRYAIPGVITAPLRTQASRQRSGVPADDDTPSPVMIELNLEYETGTRAAYERLEELWWQVTGNHDVRPLSEEYACGSLSMRQIQRLVSADAVPVKWPERAVYRIWPDFETRRLIDATAVTVGADAGRRSFNALGAGIVWAVVDSGIDGTHPHFQGYGTLTDRRVKALHKSFSGVAGDDPLVDEDGHGTHVAAIIAGGLELWDGDEKNVLITQTRYNAHGGDAIALQAPRELEAPKEHLSGMAPLAKLVSLKVVSDDPSLQVRVSRVIDALAYIRRVNAEGGTIQRINGVNISLGYEFQADWFACGRSPLCNEVDKLVRSGVVVVVAAGNSGYGTLNPQLSQVKHFGLGMTINDPGNAERAITVGSTHRDSPHTYGVSYFSSKGPTGDGRRKPDLVAPGERVTSAATGTLRAGGLTSANPKAAVYVEDTGTSVAAPHVSGVAAAFLSVRREFIGNPEEVKRVLVGSATPLGREPAFEGAGLVDLMRALQSV